MKMDIARILDIVEAIALQKRSRLCVATLRSSLPAVDGAHCWGRSEETNQLREWLANPEIKTIGIQGAIGIGKSWLAARLFENLQLFEAKFWADASNNPDFTVFAEGALMHLAGKSKDDLAYLPEPSQLINELFKCLKQRRCLIAIANVETLLDEGRHFANSYKDFFQRWNERGTTSTLLLTTQIQPEIFQDRCRWLTLKGLEAAEGGQLLKSLGIEGSDAQLQELANCLNGHPKMLHLVASLLKKAGTTQVRQAQMLNLQQLNAELALLQVPDPKRELVQFVWVLEQHWQHLSAELQEFLIALSIYRQPFRWEAAAIALGFGETAATPVTTAQALGELFSRSLLEMLPGKEHYQFHPFVWQYLQLKAIAIPDALREKVIVYYQSIATEADNWKIIQDVAAYIEIFATRCKAKQYDKAWDALSVCDEFLNVRSPTLRVELYEYLVQCWESSKTEQRKLAAALARLAHAYIELRKYSMAIECCQKALKLAEKIGDRLTIGSAFFCMGKAHDSQMQYQQAISCNKQALKIFLEIGNRLWEAATLVNMGNNYLGMGKYEQAIDCYQQGREVALSAGCEGSEAEARNGLGNVYYSLDQYELAVEFYQQALVLYRFLGDRRSEAISLSRLGDAYYALGQYQQAIARTLQSLEIKREIGYSQGVASSLQNLGKAYHTLGEYEQEIECYKQLLEIKQEIGNLPGEAKALEQLWLVYNISLQQHEQALYYYLQLQQIKQKISESQGESDALEQLGEALDALENNGPAEQ